MAFLNKAWDAEPQSMTRKQTKSSYLDNYRLSCLISTQKETLKEWLRQSNGLAEGMGLLGRFLMCFPKSTIGERIYSNAPDETPHLDRFEKRCLEHLRTKTLLDSTPILYLSKEAKKIWEDYFNDIERAQAKGGDLEDFTSAASKSAEQAARIAAVFSFFKDEYPKEIKETEMKKAIQVADWFLKQSLHLHSHLTTNKSVINATRLLNGSKAIIDLKLKL